MYARRTFVNNSRRRIPRRRVVRRPRVSYNRRPVRVRAPARRGRMIRRR